MGARPAESRVIRSCVLVRSRRKRLERPGAEPANDGTDGVRVARSAAKGSRPTTVCARGSLVRRLSRADLYEPVFERCIWTRVCGRELRREPGRVQGEDDALVG